MNRITILVLSVNEAPLLRWSLPAACAQGADEVVVIDNACTDATPELCEQFGARRLRLSRRRGYAAAMNAGLAACGGDWVLLCNADCVLDDGFVEALRPHLFSPTLGSVVPRLLHSDGMDPAHRTHELDAAGVTVDHRRRPTLIGSGSSADRFSRTGPVFGGDGACVLYRRACLEDCAFGLEVFDEDMDLWATDVDLAWRARLFGWESRYEPRAVAWHRRFSHPTRTETSDRAHRRLRFRNRLLMVAKNQTRGELVRGLPWMLAHETIALMTALTREPLLLRAYLDAFRAWPGARRRRRWVQAHRRALRARPDALASRKPPRRTPFGLVPPSSPAAPWVADDDATDAADASRAVRH
ncbi:MAG: glycosyltransferase family 2 protein [Patulibacter sp.]|nr:glycosyltransferase family 2 protein [Patulibacter sp.]